jgi:penicillin-binding protein 1A
MHPPRANDNASAAAKTALHTTYAARQLLTAIVTDLANAAAGFRSSAPRIGTLIRCTILGILAPALAIFRRTTQATRQLLASIFRLSAAATAGVISWAPRVSRLIKWASVSVILASLAGALAMLWALYHVPLDKQLGPDRSSVLVEAANGQLLGRVGRLNEPAGRNEFPDMLVKAVLSIEDRRFFSHWGIDAWGVIRAAYANWSAGAIVEGGSTLTQQLVKINYVGSDRSLDRKLREGLAALWLDLRLGKDEILTRYLNSVYLGAGAYGMPAAARIYFDKSLPELNLSESAMLAGLIQAPSRYDPIRNLEAARRRAAVVLDGMVETGAIDSNIASAARANPASIRVSPAAVQAGSWFADWIAKHELRKIAGDHVRRTVRVRTTLEPQVQDVAERAVRDALSRPEDARGATEAALIAMRPNGSVIAMVGGRNYEESQFNRAADAQRQPGSTFKLFVYYAALKNGYSPDSIIDASPVEMDRWRPENYGRQQYGRMTLSQAFAQSVNTAAVRLATTVGLKEVIAAARELGLDAPLKEVPSMALGSNEVTLLDLTGAFAAIRAGHTKLEPWGITAFASDAGGLRTLGAPAAPKDVLPQKDQLTRLLRDVVERGTGRAAAVDGANVAGKTGTSQDYRDAWFVGFTDDLIVGVWVGNDDRSPMKAMTGGSLPARIWKIFVTAATPLLLRSNQPEVAELPESLPLPTPATTQAQCNQNACAARYNSFRVSDCTYQPYGGSRRLCDLPNGSTSTGRAASNTNSPGAPPHLGTDDKIPTAALEKRTTTSRDAKLGAAQTHDPRVMDDGKRSRAAPDYRSLREYMLR